MMYTKNYSLPQLRRELLNQASPEVASRIKRFFKTMPGEYAAHENFYGIYVPVLRKIAKCYLHLNHSDLAKLLQSPIHEERLIALIILINQYKQTSSQPGKTAIYGFYISHMACINNWNLVDLSAPAIVGAYLYAQDSLVSTVLYQWARHPNLWYRRIAIVATLYFIRNQHFDTTFNLAISLLKDKEDLIHKAVGWMLREVGKQDETCLEAFLNQHYQHMPRTMLRYAIERFTKLKQQIYL